MKRILLSIVVLLALMNGVVKAQLQLTSGIKFPNSYNIEPRDASLFPEIASGNYISFGHPYRSEDFIGYGNNTFYFLDTPGGGDEAQPNLYVGGTITANSSLFVNGSILNTISRPSSPGRGGIDFSNNGFGYQYAAKFYTFKTDDFSEAYGMTQDLGTNTAAQLSLVAKHGLGNIGFYTGNSAVERLRIDQNGNVGIGTTTPQAKLHIAADNNDGVFIGKNKDGFQWNGVGVQPGYHIRFAGYRDNIDNFTGAKISALRTNLWDGGGDSRVQGMELAFFVCNKWATENGDGALTEALRIRSDGNVGIGTKTPQAKLHLNNGDNSYGAILAQATEAEFQLYTKTLTTAPINTETFRIGLKYSSEEKNGYISFYRGGAHLGGFLGFSTNGLERIRIAANGFVGIGTDSPDKELTVKGTIHAREVIVDMQGPLADYVFEPTYNLKPLAEVEKFVKEEKHLPEMPSAAEVADKGMNMGEMQNLLLKKIEELTLYTIAQNKKIEALELEMKAMKESKQ